MPRDSVRLVLALTSAEIDEFLPPSLEQQIADFYGDVTRIYPAQLGEAEWSTQLQALAPEVLVTCWHTPPLPHELPASLRYVCHLCGSTRALVSREHLTNGLVVTNWGGSVARTVAEGTLALLLSALRRSSQWAVRLHVERGWRTDGDHGESLFERRVGIHGFGMIARELTRLLAPFNTTITSFAPEVPDEVLAKHGVSRADSLETLFAQNQIVVELAPLTPDSVGVITERHLRLITDGGVFVNVARGAIVEEEGLLRVATEGRLQIALDVYHQEPLPADSPLRGLMNVTLSPHLAGPTNDRRRDAGAFAVRNLRAYRQRQHLEGVVTLSIYDHAT